MDKKKELSLQQERELRRKLRAASGIAEIKEIGSQLGMDFTEELAQEYLKTISQNKPEKGFCELLREAHATDDSTQKEVIYEKIAEQERKRVEQELFHRWSDTVDREEYIQLTMQLFPKVSKARAEAMADELNL